MVIEYKTPVKMKDGGAGLRATHAHSAHGAEMFTSPHPQFPHSKMGTDATCQGSNESQLGMAARLVCATVSHLFPLFPYPRLCYSSRKHPEDTAIHMLQTFIIHLLQCIFLIIYQKASLLQTS